MELCSCHKLQHLIESLSSGVEKNALLLQKLQSDLEQRVDNSELSKLVQTLNGRLASIEERLDGLEADVRPQNEFVEVGSKTIQNCEAISHLQSQMEDAVFLSKWNSEKSAMEDFVNREMENIRATCISHSFVEKLESVQHSLQDRMRFVEKSVATKVDESDLSRLESLAERLGSFDKWRASHTDDFAILQKDVATVIEDAQKAFDRADAAHSAFFAVRQAVGQRADKGAVEALQEQANASGAQLAKLLADFDSLLEQRESERISSLKAREEESGLLSSKLAALKEATDRLTALVEGRATVDALNEKADVAVVADLVRQLRCDLSGKVWQSAMDGVETQLKAMAEEMSVLQKQCDVATRFVDWFAKRGEPYEHNLAVLESRLNSMIPGQHSSFLLKKRELFEAGISHGWLETDNLGEVPRAVPLRWTEAHEEEKKE